MNKYSVVTVTFNSEKALPRTIDSVLGQAVLPFEYIFVDGGSQDKTLEIIKSYDFISKGIKTIIQEQKERNGIFGAINQGIQAASGDVIFILHSDDWLEPDAAEAVLAKFAKEPDCDIVRSSAYIHSFDGKKYLKHQRSFLLFPFLMPVIHPGAFVHRKAYEKYGLYDEKFRISSDYEFFYRIYKVGAKFCEIRKPLVNVQLGGYANTHREQARKETLEIAIRHARFSLLPWIAYFSRKITGR
ncbi:MAG: glycosyltransferase family 2 protein [Candidatus Nanoarchaeia archaeon]